MRYCDKFAQGRNGLRHAHAAAYIQHRLFRLRQHLASLFNLRMGKHVVAFNGGEVRFQIAECNLNIFRDIYQNRAGRPELATSNASAITRGSSSRD